MPSAKIITGRWKNEAFALAFLGLILAFMGTEGNSNLPTELIEKVDFVRNCEPCGGYFPDKGKKAKHHRRHHHRRHKHGHKFRIVGGRRSSKPRPWMAFLEIQA